MILSRPSQGQTIVVSALWALVAIGLGLVVATQPQPFVVVSLALGLFVLTGFVTPFALIAAMLVLSPLRTVIATESGVALPLDIGQFGFLIVVASWVIYHVARGKAFRFRMASPLVSVLVVYLVILSLSVFPSISVGAWMNEWLKWLLILVVVLVVSNLVVGRNWEWLVFSLVVAGTGNAFVGIYEFFGGSGALHLLIDNRFFRAFGTFGQPNPFGGFMGLMIPLSTAALMGYGLLLLKHWRTAKTLPFNYTVALLFYVFTTIVMILAIGMSWSRGAWLGLGVALTVMAFAVPRNLRRGLFGLLVIVCVSGILWLAGVLPASIVERLSNSTQEFFAFEDVRGVDVTPENYAVVERLAHWQAALNMGRSHPWLGVGLGNYEVVYPQYRLLNWTESLGHAHNYYLNIFAETGLIGLLVYGKVWLIIMGLSWRIRRHPDILTRLIGIGLLGSWTYLLVHSIFDNLYVNNLFIHLGLMLGILAVLYNQVCITQRS